MTDVVFLLGSLWQLLLSLCAAIVIVSVYVQCSIQALQHSQYSPLD